MVRTRLNIEVPPTARQCANGDGHFTPEPSQTQAPVTPATEPERMPAKVEA